MPYAAKANITHKYISNKIELWVTFALPMKRSSNPLAVPEVFDFMPAVSVWTVEADGVDYAVGSSDWTDDWTLHLVSETVDAYPILVYLSYAGLDYGLQTAWGKQWEAWAVIPSVDLAANLWITGMILMWSGAIADIPIGWHLCDGVAGTPNLEDKFVVGAGRNYAVAAHSTVSTHTHAATQAVHNHSLAGGIGVGTGAILSGSTTNATPIITVPSASHIPPYYALAYIMKL